MGLVFKRRLTPTQKLIQELSGVKVRLKELWQERLITSGADIAEIIDGTYISTGSDGSSELNGVPTQKDIADIIAGIFSHYEPDIDEFAINNPPSEDDIDKIISGEFSGEPYVSSVPTEDDIAKIISGTY